MAEDRIEVTHLMGKKLDKPIIMKWKSETKKNKMEQVAALFGKKLGEDFEILYKDENYTAYFRNEGLRVRGLFCLTWDNVLVALLTGRAVIVDE